MNKSEFLEKLRKRLDILNNSEVEDVILEYSSHIDEKVKKGKITEEQAIEEFGDFDELVKEILSAYKINDSKASKKNFSGLIDEIVDTFEGLINLLSKKDLKTILKFIIELVIIIAIICLFKIPVEILLKLASSVFSGLPFGISSAINIIFRVVFELSYLILAVIFFIKIFKSRYLDNINEFMSESKEDSKPQNKEEKKKEQKENKKDPKIVSAKKEEPKVVRHTSFSDTVIKLLHMFFRVMVGFILFPSMFAVAGFVVLFGVGIGLFIGGAHYFGILLCIFASMMFGIVITEMLFNFVFNHKIQVARLFISLMVTIFLFGLGMSIATFEIAKSSYVDSPPGNYEIKTVTEEFNAKDVNAFYSPYGTRLVEDESLKDKIKIEINYYEKLSNPEVNMQDKTIQFSFDGVNIRGGEIYKLIKDDLKNKTFHNYTNLFTPQITIYASKATFEKMEEHLEDDLVNSLHETIDDLNKEIDNLREETANLAEERDLWIYKYNERFSRP